MRTCTLLNPCPTWPLLQALLASGVLSLTLATLVPGPTATVTETATAAAGAAAAGGGFSTEWVEGAAILATVAIVVVVNAATNFAKESKFRQLNSIKDDVRVGPKPSMHSLCTFRHRDWPAIHS